MLINNCDLRLRKNSSSQVLKDRWRLHRQNIQLSKQEPRQGLFVTHKTKHCPNVKICPTLAKGGEKL